MRLFLILLLFPMLAFAQMGNGYQGYAGAAATNGYPGGPAPNYDQRKSEIQNVLDQLQQAQLQISNPQSNAVQSCGISQTCSFREVCKDLQKNRNAKVLYRNSKGEEMMNWGRLKIDSQMNQCLNDGRTTLLQTDVMKSANDAQAKFNETLMGKQKEQSRAQLEFMREIVKNGDSEKYNKVTIVMQEMTLDQNYAIAQDYKSFVTAAIQRAGVTLSVATMTKWDEVSNSMVTFNAGAGLPSQTPQYSANSGFQPTTTENPFFEPRLSQDPYAAGGETKMAAYQKQLKEANERAKDLLDQTIKLATQVLESHKNQANGSRIDQMILRIEKVKYKEAGAASATCAGGPNAYYKPTGHVIEVCPSALNSPEGNLIQTLGHEIGHPIDPCFLAKDMDVNEKGVITHRPAEIAQAPKAKNLHQGIHYDQNPFGGVLTCLQNEDNSLGAKVSSAEARARYKVDLVEAYHESGGEKAPAIPKTLLSAERKYRGCANDSNEKEISQMQEAFADWLSGEIVKLRIKNEANPTRRRELAFEAINNLGNVTCVGVTPEIPQGTMDKLADLGCVVEDKFKVAGISPGEEHSQSYKRVNNVLMAIPEIADALGCKTTTGINHCE